MKAVVIFSKYPEPGKSKTRLAKTIGEDQAASYHMNFLKNLFELHDDQDYELLISSPFPEDKEKFSNISGARFLLQPKGDLGEKMYQCFKILEGEYEKIMIIGSDVPTIDSERVHEAFSALSKNDVVLGPTVDGGYYLVAMRKPNDIFRDIDWSTEKVLKQQIKNIEKLGLKYKLLKEERDIDTEEDLQHYKEFQEEI